MSEKDWTIGNIIALAEHFGKCIHRNFNATYYHGEIDVREREKKEANENEIEARTELEQAVSGILDERDALRMENKEFRKTLTKISDRSLESYEDYEMSDAAYSMRDDAQEALMKVKKMTEVTAEFCEWTGKIKRMGKVDEYLQYKSPHEPPHYHNVIGNLDDRQIFIYCHVCGKKIKHVEVE